MTQAIIYKLTNNPWSKVFPKVVESIVNKGNRIHVLAEEKMVALIDDLLWSFEQLSFLPHATCGDANLADQPIVISHNSDVKNGAKVLALANRDLPDNFQEFEKIICLFDSESEQKIPQMLSQLSEKKVDAQLYLQNDKGAWAKQERL